MVSGFGKRTIGFPFSSYQQLYQVFFLRISEYYIETKKY